VGHPRHSRREALGTRGWRPRGIEIGERIAIHAAKGWTRADVDFAFDLAGRDILPLARHAEPDFDLPRGAILGTVRFTGRWAWGLILPHEYVRPIPARGALGLWEWTR